MKIESRAKAYAEEHKDLPYSKNAYEQGARDQMDIDHSDKHLDWILQQEQRWLISDDECTFGEWIKRQLTY